MVVTAESPLREDHSEELICSMKLTCPDRSSCAAVVSCGTTRNTTLLKCVPVQPPQYFGNALRTTSNSWFLFQVCAVYGPVPASCPAFSQWVRAWPPPAACVS